MYSSTWSVCKSVRGGNLHRRHSLRPLRHLHRSNLKPKRQLCWERGRRWRRGPKSRKLTRDRRRPSLQLLLEAVLVPCSEVGGEESNLNCCFNISAPCWIFSDCMFVHRVYQILVVCITGVKHSTKACSKLWNEYGDPLGSTISSVLRVGLCNKIDKMK